MLKIFFSTKDKSFGERYITTFIFNKTLSVNKKSFWDFYYNYMKERLLVCRIYSSAEELGEGVGADAFFL